MDRLQKQLKNPETKQDAEDCIKIYNYLEEQSGGHVWSSQWGPLTNVKFKGFPSDERNYSLNNIGKLVLKGLENN